MRYIYVINIYRPIYLGHKSITHEVIKKLNSNFTKKLNNGLFVFLPVSPVVFFLLSGFNRERFEIYKQLQTLQSLRLIKTAGLSRGLFDH